MPGQRNLRLCARTGGGDFTEHEARRSAATATPSPVSGGKHCRLAINFLQLAPVVLASAFLALIALALAQRYCTAVRGKGAFWAAILTA